MEGQLADHYTAEPNVALISEVSGRAPGRAVDLGCGTGADAIWLASHGWEVTAVDISPAATDTATRLAEESGVAVEWLCADFINDPPAERSFDLVTAFYPALPKSLGEKGADSLTRGVGPGGTLLVVGHSPAGRDAARVRGFDPSGYMEPSDICAHLDREEWHIQLSDSSVASSGSTQQSSTDADVILRATRRR